MLIGVDGLEWSVLLPLSRAGRLPVLTRLMQEGSFGRLKTILPTLSPRIWTTIATGKEPGKHGIEGFRKPRQKGSPRALYSSRDRRSKALWNVLSDFGRSVHSLGWWLTFPAEAINGVMVAQTNTRQQISPRGPRAPWKGTVVPGLQGQVSPAALQGRVIGIAQEVADSLPRLTRQAFGEFSAALPAAALDDWSQSLWSFRADNIYLRVAKEILADPELGVPDLLMVYFGMPDVVGHRFWRHAFPDAFEHPPSPEEIDGFSQVIAESYVWVDRAIGNILESYAEGATIIVASDHGMNAANRSVDFAEEAGKQSGQHFYGRPGVLIISGARARRLEAPGSDDLASAPPPFVGRIQDLAPTILALQGVPVGRDMDGVVLEHLLAPGFLERHPVSYLDTHDSEAWLEERPEQTLSREAELQRLEQLRALGYFD